MNGLKKILKKVYGEELDPETEKFIDLIEKPPEKTVWVTKPTQKWYVAYNSVTMRMTYDDTFSSELGVFNYPIGIANMTIPKYFIPSSVIIRMLSSMEWAGGDLRPEKKYRALRRPGVVEVLY